MKIFNLKENKINTEMKFNLLRRGEHYCAFDDDS